MMPSYRDKKSIQNAAKAGLARRLQNRRAVRAPGREADRHSDWLIIGPTSSVTISCTR
jgi:hypothetical protein